MQVGAGADWCRCQPKSRRDRNKRCIQNLERLLQRTVVQTLPYLTLSVTIAYPSLLRHVPQQSLYRILDPKDSIEPRLDFYGEVEVR